MPRTKRPDTLTPAQRSAAWRASNVDPKVRINEAASAKLNRLAARDGVTRKEAAEAAIMAAPE